MRHREKHSSRNLSVVVVVVGERRWEEGEVKREEGGRGREGGGEEGGWGVGGYSSAA